MRERGIGGVTRRRRRSLTKPDVKAAPAPDLIGRDFTAARPGARLVGDTPYVPTAEGWLYLATVIDLFSREVVGWSMAGHMRADLVIDALRMAGARGALAKGAVFHTDRGGQGSAAAFRAAAARLGVRRSMGRTGSASTTPRPRASSRYSRRRSAPGCG